MAEISDNFLRILTIYADCVSESKAKKDSNGAYFMHYLSWYDVDGNGSESESDSESDSVSDSNKPAIDIHLHVRVGKENWITKAYEMEQTEWKYDGNEVGKTYALGRLAKIHHKIQKYIDDECGKTDFSFFDQTNVERM